MLLLVQLQQWEATWKMEFHPQKCQVLRITNKRKHLPFDYKIHNISLQETNSAKYLGVTIDSKLNWKEQYSTTSKKANRILAFLRRNINDCPTHIKEKCYKTFTRPILEYGSVVWDPHFRTDIEKLEQIQKRAGRFVTGNYRQESGNTLINMQKLGWAPLEERRARCKLNMFYKARMGLVDIPFDVKENKNRSRRPGTYAIPSSNLDCHLHSFYPSTIRLWNSLPEAAKLAHNDEIFKSTLETIKIKASF